ncbi:MAG: TetR/AcrR family transcriptional regulator [Hamadaea sp.]|uniref:TetR/AcrR family transcriptional regulator n=1 Tax=Hamadaea sp. NPDC050747 TaxID=3155789 RepID=UPI001806B014|nr:TetR/AcrR family transcriptional regulator [Hamadaea sp.]NUT03943.1 TetR/AcrR family transcriptional regulator [Hamadaea sp.]
MSVQSRTLLDIAAEVLVADPAASLAEVARAAGIGRTTLHKHYATRDDLLYAVAHRALELWEDAVSSIPDGPDGGLRTLAEAMIPIGPQLEFLWRTPAFDHVVEIGDRWRAVEARGLAVLQRAQAHGVLRTAPPWWLLQTFYSLIYVAAECVMNGKLAPADAPDLLLSTFLTGLGKDPA